MGRFEGEDWREWFLTWSLRPLTFAMLSTSSEQSSEFKTRGSWSLLA